MLMLFACRPSLGHIQPMLPLARAVRAAGHEVIFATAVNALPGLASMGYGVAKAGEPPSPTIRAVNDGPDSPPLEQARMANFTRFFVGVEMEPRLRDLEGLIRSRRPDVIVHEIAEVASPLAAAAAGLPLVTMGFGPLLDPEVAQAVSAAGAHLWQARGLEAPRWGGLYRDLYIDPCPPALQVSQIVELPAVQAMRTQDGEAGPAPGWIAAAKAPLAYVTFGTTYNKKTERFSTVIEALKTLPVEVLVTLGEDSDPASFKPQPATVRIERFVPQNTVLSHCRLSVCHGGAGTILGALAFGVPMLLLPQGADQYFNAQRSCAAGVALMLRPPEATLEAIALAASRLLNDPSFAVRARAVAGEIAAMPGPAEAVTRIEHLI